MSEYYTAPDAPAAGSRAKSSLISDIIDSIDDGFDALPTGLDVVKTDLATLETEVETARGDEDDLDTRLDGLDSDIAALADAELPDQAGNAGTLLTTNGSVSSWDTDHSYAKKRFTL